MPNLLLVLTQFDSKHVLKLLQFICFSWSGSADCERTQSSSVGGKGGSVIWSWDCIQGKDPGEGFGWIITCFADNFTIRAGTAVLVSILMAQQSTCYLCQNPELHIFRIF